VSLREQRVAIISFDGLSSGQFERLQAQMPALHSLLTEGHLIEFDAAPFSDAQPIWAEILTGTTMVSQRVRWICNTDALSQ